MAICCVAIAVTGWSVEEGASTKQSARKAVLSGPQKGEKLGAFKVRGVYDEISGKEVDFVTHAAGKPILLVFFNGEKRSRPALGLARLLLAYVLDVGKDKMVAHLVWLDKDVSVAEKFLGRLLRDHLAPGTSAGVSLDGNEGPGAYALSQDTALTVVVGKENTVTANFALGRPSEREAPKILAEVAKLIGAKPPTSRELEKYRLASRTPGNRRLDKWLREILARDLSDEGLEKQAERIEKFVVNKPRLQQKLGVSLARLVNRPGFERFGTKAARDKLRALAKKYPPPTRRSKATDTPRRPTPEKAPEKKPQETDKTPGA